MFRTGTLVLHSKFSGMEGGRELNPPQTKVGRGGGGRTFSGRAFSSKKYAKLFSHGSRANITSRTVPTRLCTHTRTHRPTGASRVISDREAKEIISKHSSFT